MSKKSGVQALFCIVRDPTFVERLMTGFLEIGVTGASVINTRGMGQILSHEVPIFSGFKSLFPGEDSENQLIVTVIHDELLDQVLALIQDVCGGFNELGSGIVFVLPVSHIFGLKEEMA